MRFVEKCGVYFICLNIVSGDSFNDDVPSTVAGDNDNHPSVLATLDRAMQALATEDLSHLTVDASNAVPPPPDAPCSGVQCRDGCCRGRLVKRPGRKSSFTRPVP